MTPSVCSNRALRLSSAGWQSQSGARTKDLDSKLSDFKHPQHWGIFEWDTATCSCSDLWPLWTGRATVTDSVWYLHLLICFLLFSVITFCHEATWQWRLWLDSLDWTMSAMSHGIVGRMIYSSDLLFLYVNINTKKYCFYVVIIKNFWMAGHQLKALRHHQVVAMDFKII